METSIPVRWEIGRPPYGRHDINNEKVWWTGINMGVEYFPVDNVKIKIQSSCEIEYFVKIHIILQAVFDTPIARITCCVSSLRI